MIKLGMWKRISWLTVSIALLLSSCIKEDRDDCGFYLRLVYDYNLKYVDAFSEQASKVNLYVFDSHGNFITELEDSQTPFSKAYKMYIPLDPDKPYTFIAWVGLYEQNYILKSPMKQGATPSDLYLQLAQNEATNTVNKELKPLWHGKLDYNGTTPDPVISLTKNTNKVRLVLQSLNQKDENPINADDYLFRIAAANGEYDHLNTPQGKEISYTPYFSSQADAGAIVELNTLRLMADQENKLEIKNKNTGEILLDINLNKYISALRLLEFDAMPLQEYMDRQDEYKIVFFFKENTAIGGGDMFLYITVEINGWVIREQIV